ncbi:MAG: hypothetical protein GY804_10735 [Alphaproteobacteria bacterium]|nr:hypothetical protein [Alphaproteobacteria bacterium]
MRKFNAIICALLIATSVTACKTTQQHVLDSGESQVQLRQIQTRRFDTTDKTQTVRDVISAMQDLGFVIDKADAELGTVSATKLDGYKLKLTASVRPKGKKMLVRASAQYNITPITNPKPYQDFFNTLSKTMFLTANNID